VLTLLRTQHYIGSQTELAWWDRSAVTVEQLDVLTRAFHIHWTTPVIVRVLRGVDPGEEGAIASPIKYVGAIVSFHFSKILARHCWPRQKTSKKYQYHNMYRFACKISKIFLVPSSRAPKLGRSHPLQIPPLDRPLLRSPLHPRKINLDWHYWLQGVQNQLPHMHLQPMRGPGSIQSHPVWRAGDTATIENEFGAY